MNQVPHPHFDSKRPNQSDWRNFSPCSGLLDFIKKGLAIDDSKRSENHMVGRPKRQVVLLRDPEQRTARHEGLSLSIQDFLRNDSDERPTHQGTALTGSHQLFSGNCEEEFQEIAVEVRIALLMNRLTGVHITSYLPPERVECGEVFLKCRERTKQPKSVFVAGQGGTMSVRENWIEPWSGTVMLRDAGASGKKSACNFE